MFFVPYGIEVKHSNAPIAKTDYYPLVPNRINDCVTGKLYDVRGYFDGAKFAETDFAWFSPENNLLVVRASPADIDFMNAVLETTFFCPAANLILDADISVGSHPEANDFSGERSCWRIYSKTGQRISASVAGSPGLAYTWEFEPVVAADGNFLDYNMVLKVTHEGREYSVTTSATIPLAKRHTLILGTTLAKDEVSFHVTPVMEWAVPATPLDNPKKKGQLLECIRKHLAE